MRFIPESVRRLSLQLSPGCQPQDGEERDVRLLPFRATTLNPGVVSQRYPARVELLVRCNVIYNAGDIAKPQA
jgi:hypothetical protein